MKTIPYEGKIQFSPPVEQNGLWVAEGEYLGVQITRIQTHYRGCQRLYSATVSGKDVGPFSNQAALINAVATAKRVKVAGLIPMGNGAAAEDATKLGSVVVATKPKATRKATKPKRRMTIKPSPRLPLNGRELPSYTIAEAAHYLGVPTSTIRYWSVGRNDYKPLIRVPRRSPVLLSFLHLTELHVLTALRREHGVQMQSVRKAIQYLVRNASLVSNKRHPLISCELETDGLDLFIEEYGKRAKISQMGQTTMWESIRAALCRINRDAHGIPIKFYPFTRNAMDDAPAMVVIDPTLSAGRPVIAGTGLATELIAERYKAGESVLDLAHDYERGNEEIEEAIRYELPAAA